MHAFYENVKFQTVKSRKKSLEPRGALSNYLTCNSEETIFENTLTGFLISFYFRTKNNEGYTFDELLQAVNEVYEKLRRPNGQLYMVSNKNLKRSLICALSANGLFQQGIRQAKAQGSKRHTKFIQPSQNVWLICKEAAIAYKQ